MKYKPNAPYQPFFNRICKTCQRKFLPQGKRQRSCNGCTLKSKARNGDRAKARPSLRYILSSIEKTQPKGLLTSLVSI